MPEVFRDLLTCVVCDKGGDSIKKCGMCLSVSYCGRECQVADWARHKRLCVPVMVKDFGEKGRRLVASKNFKVGDLIFKDTSVASIIFADEVHIINTVKFLAKYGKEVYAQISKLSDADQKSFFELSGNAKVYGILSDPIFGSIPENYKRAWSIFSNNQRETCEKNKAHLYLKYSMVNHSCEPNTLADSPEFDAKRIEVRAIKEIKVGEEVTSSYLDAYTAILGERKEKKLKFESRGFQCKCDICLQPETDRIKKLRDEWNEIKLKEDTLIDAIKKLNDRPKFSQKDRQTFANSLDKRVDFIIKVDNPFLSFSSKHVYCELSEAGLLTGRLDLQKKGKSHLKKVFFGDIGIDKFMMISLMNDKKRIMIKDY